MAGLFNAFGRIGDSPAEHVAAVERAAQFRANGHAPRAKRQYERVLANIARLGTPPNLHESRRLSLVGLGEMAVEAGAADEAFAHAEALAANPYWVEDAARLLVHPLTLDPELRSRANDLRFTLGYRLFSSGQLAAVAAVLRAHDARGPRETALLGHALARGGDLAGAVEALRGEPAVRLQLGHVLAAAGRPAEALAAYDAAPETPGIQLYRADVLLRLGHLHRAKTDLDRAEPGAAVSYTRGRLALADDDPATARTHFSAALEQDPRYGAARLGLGMACELDGNLVQAHAAYEDYRDTTRVASPRLAVTAVRTGIGADAALLDTVADPYLRGLLHAHLRQYDAAVARWNTLGTAPEALAVLTAARADRLARAAFDAGDRTTARTHWQAARDAVPGEPAYPLAIAETHVRDLAGAAGPDAAAVTALGRAAPDDLRARRYEAQAALLGTTPIRTAAGTAEPRERQVETVLRTLLDGPLADDSDSRTLRWRAAAYLELGKPATAARLAEIAGSPAPLTDLARLAWAVERGDRETVRTLSDRVTARFATGPAAVDQAYLNAVRALVAADTRGMSPAEATQSLTQAAEFARGTPAEGPVAAERARRALAAGDEAAALAVLGEQGPKQLQATLLQRAAGRHLREGRRTEAYVHMLRALRLDESPPVLWRTALVTEQCARAGAPFGDVWRLLVGTWAAMLSSRAYWDDLARRTGRPADPERIAAARDFHRERISRLIGERASESRDFRSLATTWRLECAFLERAEPLRAQPSGILLLGYGPCLAMALDRIVKRIKRYAALCEDAGAFPELWAMLGVGRYPFLLDEGDYDAVIDELAGTKPTGPTADYLVAAYAAKITTLHGRAAWEPFFEQLAVVWADAGPVRGMESMIADAAQALAKTALAGDDRAGAAEALERGLRYAPGDARIIGDLAATYNAWAAMLSRREETGKAHRLVGKALALSPQEPLFRENYTVSASNWASKLMRSDRFGEAAEVLLELRERLGEPKELDLLFYCLARTDRLADAARYLAPGAEADKAWRVAVGRYASEVAEQAATYRGRDGIPAGIDVLEYAIGRRDDAQLRWLLVNFLMDLKRFREAAEAIEDAQRRTPRTDDVAAENLERMRGLLPVARHNHAMALTDGGDYSAAITQFRAALDAGGSETTRNMMAQCYAVWAVDRTNSRAFREARTLIDQAVQLKPHDAEFLELQGKIHLLARGY
ncbi:hypothetical protein ACPA54_22150 [Uniformispora flossi]|uniref:hypothetical protein n=1 Tax=Uniformispora flossi TaxID=3390723 RepID=UPI003C2AC68B